MGLFDGSVRKRMRERQAARKAMRKRVQEHRIAEREKRRMARIDARAHRKAARLHKRDPGAVPEDDNTDLPDMQPMDAPEPEQTDEGSEETSEVESENYEHFHPVPIQKSRIRKIGRSYGGFSPMQVEQLHDLSRKHPHMLRELKAQGVKVNNRHDPLEVAAKYVNSHPEMYLDKEVEEHFDNAYNTPPESFESHFDWQSIKNAGKSAMKGAVGGIMGQLGTHIEDLKDKEKSGKPLTASEAKLLGAANSIQDGVVQHAELNVLDTLKSLAPYIILLVVVIIIGKKLKWF